MREGMEYARGLRGGRNSLAHGRAWRMRRAEQCQRPRVAEADVLNPQQLSRWRRRLQEERTVPGPEPLLACRSLAASVIRNCKKGSSSAIFRVTPKAKTRYVGPSSTCSRRSSTTTSASSCPSSCDGDIIGSGNYRAAPRARHSWRRPVELPRAPALPLDWRRLKVAEVWKRFARPSTSLKATSSDSSSSSTSATRASDDFWRTSDITATVSAAQGARRMKSLLGNAPCPFPSRRRRIRIRATQGRYGDRQRRARGVLYREFDRNAHGAFPSRTKSLGRATSRNAQHGSGSEIRTYCAPLTPLESRAHAESVKIVSSPSPARTHLPRSRLPQSRQIRAAGDLYSVT
ncbi:hypothetical protein EXIGLDRAFT_138531 [Exidia glandulosa HHB12029]|uniref:Uncharacterized protein n=1 Tax=Exidia glandulosa HHB12029 TaxID=1314781 RepID=A0A166A9D9_EXIGL|nr:hypothetical protein EXIGLDRAFT_138531 [Exidia glandulosa HHB12029]